MITVIYTPEPVHTTLGTQQRWAGRVVPAYSRHRVCGVIRDDAAITPPPLRLFQQRCENRTARSRSARAAYTMVWTASVRPACCTCNGCSELPPPPPPAPPFRLSNPHTTPFQFTTIRVCFTSLLSYQPGIFYIFLCI